MEQEQKTTYEPPTPIVVWCPYARCSVCITTRTNPHEWTIGQSDEGDIICKGTVPWKGKDREPIVHFRLVDRSVGGESRTSICIMTCPEWCQEANFVHGIENDN